MTKLENHCLLGDCLKELPKLEDKSVDMILTDLPYGVTARNLWDSIIPIKPLFKELKRICKGAIVMTAVNPFASELIYFNKDIFKYEWVFQKSRATNFLNSKIQPLRKHELVLVFYQNNPIFNPQFTKGLPYNKGMYKTTTTNYQENNELRIIKNDNGNRYPIDCIYFTNELGLLHPTQKPILLFEYLIKTYSNKDNIVLDCCAGSGTTAIACINTNRKYICIEKDEGYYKLMQDRISTQIKPLEAFNWQSRNVVEQ